MSQRHATDVISLIFGIIFGGIFAVWALTGADVIDLRQVGLAGPAILIAAGAVGLAVALRDAGREVR
jgi:uncharacterized membrane protein